MEQMFNAIILQVVRSVDQEVDGWPGMMYLWTVFHWLAMSHTCYNPVILCWMNKKFRSGFCYVAYHIPCLRRHLDSCFTQEEDLMTANTYAHGSRLSSRMLVTISMKDDSIVFKSRHCNGTTSGVEFDALARCDQGPRRFLQAMEDTSSDSRL